MLGGLILFLAIKASYIAPIVYLGVGAFIGVMNMFVSASFGKGITVSKRLSTSILIAFGWCHFLAFLVYFLVNENKFNEKFKSGIDSL